MPRADARFWPVTVAAAALVGLLAYGVVSKGADTTLDEAVAKGKRPAAPVGALPWLAQTGTGSLADYKGKVVVLNVWASWCDPCREEMPLLQKTHEKIESQGGVVLGVDTQDASDKAIDFLKRAQATFPSLRDRDRAYGREFGVTGYPETFLIDRKGRSRRCGASRSRRRGWTSTCPSCWRRRHESRSSLAARRCSAFRPRAAAAPRASLPDIEDEVMCVECGTVLSVSNSPVAKQERAFIREQIAAGKDKQQIKAALVDQYGEEVLADPGAAASTRRCGSCRSCSCCSPRSGSAFAVRRWRAPRRRRARGGARRRR